MDENVVDLNFPAGTRLLAVGVDTLSFSWQLSEISAQAAALTEMDRTWAPRRRYGLSTMPRTFRGETTIGWDSRYAKVLVEGRAAALATGDAGDRSLLRVAALPTLEAALLPEVEMHLQLVPLGAQPGVLRRLDLTADVEFSRVETGRATLEAIALLRVSRWQTKPYYVGAEATGVQWLRRRDGRWHQAFKVYDPATVYGGEVGRVLRFERQLRWGGSERPRPEALPSDLSTLWADGIETWELPGATRPDAPLGEALGQVLTLKPEEGYPARTVERLIGATVIEALGGSEWWASRGKPHIGARRRRELADAGIIQPVAPGAALRPSMLAIEPSALFGALTEAWRRELHPSVLALALDDDPDAVALSL